MKWSYNRKQDWTFIALLEKGGHRVFVRKGDSRLAVADESGTYPDETDDGVLWIHPNSPHGKCKCKDPRLNPCWLVVEDPSMRVCWCSVRVQKARDPKDDKSHIGVGLEGAMRLRTICAIHGTLPIMRPVVFRTLHGTEYLIRSMPDAETVSKWCDAVAT